TCAMLLPIAVHYGVRVRELGEPSLRWWLCTLRIGCGLMFSVWRSAMLSLAVVSAVLLAGCPDGRRLRALLAWAGFWVEFRIAEPGLLGTFVLLLTYLGNGGSIQFGSHACAVDAQQSSRNLCLGCGRGTWCAP